MSFEESEDGSYEVWTCDVCGHTIILQGLGGDVSDCPRCLENEYREDDEAEDFHKAMPEFCREMRFGN